MSQLLMCKIKNIDMSSKKIGKHLENLFRSFPFFLLLGDPFLLKELDITPQPLKGPPFPVQQKSHNQNINTVPW